MQYTRYSEGSGESEMGEETCKWHDWGRLVNRARKSIATIVKSSIAKREESEGGFQLGSVRSPSGSRLLSISKTKNEFFDLVFRLGERGVECRR